MSQLSSKQFIGAVQDEWQLYSDKSEDYTLGAPIGFGASSIVYTAIYNPGPPANPVPCALKVLDLDSLPQHSLRLLQRETTLMSLSKHPNVLRVRGSWMDGHKLFIAMRLMNRGSAADVMRYGWPGGMEEEVVKCILKQALEGLNYLHINGFIHRDVKAANMLIDDDGTVLLGDLGVAANLADDPDHAHVTPKSFQARHTGAAAFSTTNAHKRAVNFDPAIGKPRPKIGKRKSFVGTPCWMAPELISGHQYDASADIWSFGVTALELTQGRPPRSRESSAKVLLKIVQDAPPTLDREGGTYKYSRAFKEVVESCLVKDPSKRPTAAELLQTPFFRSAKKKGYLVSTILADLPPLVQRQERTATHKHLTPNRTIDSWDFSTTRSSRLGNISPTASVHRRTRTIGLLDTTSIHEGVHFGKSDRLSLDSESTKSSRHSGSGSGNGSRSKSFTLHDTQTTGDRKRSLDDQHDAHSSWTYDGRDHKSEAPPPIPEMRTEQLDSEESPSDSGLEAASTPGTSPVSYTSVHLNDKRSMGRPESLAVPVLLKPHSHHTPTSSASPTPTGTINQKLWRRLSRSGGTGSLQSSATTAVSAAEESDRGSEGSDVEKKPKRGLRGILSRKATAARGALERHRSRGDS